MTIVPSPSGFVHSGRMPDLAGPVGRPHLTEHFWGYEVSPTLKKMTMAVAMRPLAGTAAGLSVLGAICVWAAPSMIAVAASPFAKIAVSGFLICLAIVLAKTAARGTVVRVQIDTAAGELREVVSGPFGAPVLLSRHGFDAVSSVELAASKTQTSVGQIHIGLRDGGIVPVGDGALVALSALRSRLASDCGLETRLGSRQVIWSGSIAA